MSSRVANGLQRSAFAMSAAAHSSLRSFSCHAAGALCLTVILTVSGAFDTDDLGLDHRLGLWFVVSGLIIGQVSLLDRLFVRMLPNGAAYQGAAALSAVFLTVLLMTIELHGLKFTPFLPKEPDPLLEFAFFVMPAVSAVGGFVLLLKSPATQGGVPVDGPKGQADERLGPTLLSAPVGSAPSVNTRMTGLENWPESPVLRVGAQDHYLDVVTAQGSVLIRGRMRDALVKLRDADGLQVHRFWWVASGEVAEVRRKARDYVLILKDKTEIPVGRMRVEELRAKAWV